MWKRFLVVAVFVASLPVSMVAINALQNEAVHDKPRERPIVQEMTQEHLRFRTVPGGVNAGICGQGVGIDSDAELAAAHLIDEAVAKARRHPDWGWVESYIGNSYIQLGCPSPIFYDGHGKPSDGYSFLSADYKATVPMRIYVYPDQALANQSNRHTLEEHYCSGDTCDTTAQALYLTPADFCQHDRLVTVVLWAFGLMGYSYDAFPGDATPRPTIDPPC